MSRPAAADRRAGFGPPSPVGRRGGGRKPTLRRRSTRLVLSLAAILLAAMPAAAQSFEGRTLRCLFGPVESAGQPARRIEIRPGPWDDSGLDLYEDDGRVPLWVEDGDVVGPIWPMLILRLTDGLTMTVQSTPSNGVVNLMSWRSDGPALLSTHDAASDPSRVMGSTAVGTCTIAEAD